MVTVLKANQPTKRQGGEGLFYACYTNSFTMVSAQILRKAEHEARIRGGASLLCLRYYKPKALRVRKKDKGAIRRSIVV